MAQVIWLPDEVFDELKRFVHGCVEAINAKLKELTPKYETSTIVKAEMAKNGIVLRKASIRGIEGHAGSMEAGSAVGKSARFDRPVEAGGMRYLK